MKIKTLIAASVLAGAGVVGGVSQSASAGCGVTITADNDENNTVTVDWDRSQVRTWQYGFAGPWKDISNYRTNIPANAQVDRAFTLDLKCSLARQYRLYVTGGGNSAYEYHNEVGPTGSWTTDTTPFIDIE